MLKAALSRARGGQGWGMSPDPALPSLWLCPLVALQTHCTVKASGSQPPPCSFPQRTDRPQLRPGEEISHPLFLPFLPFPCSFFFIYLFIFPASSLFSPEVKSNKYAFHGSPFRAGDQPGRYVLMNLPSGQGGLCPGAPASPGSFPFGTDSIHDDSGKEGKTGTLTAEISAREL